MLKLSVICVTICFVGTLAAPKDDVEATTDYPPLDYPEIDLGDNALDMNRPVFQIVTSPRPSSNRAGRSWWEDLYCGALATWQCQNGCTGIPCDEICTAACIFGSCPPVLCGTIAEGYCIPPNTTTPTTIKRITPQK